MKDTQKLTQILIDFGLSEHEAGVYFAGISLGPCTVLDLAKTAGIKRSTVYSVIEQLKAKGLMAEEVKGLKKRFVVEPPVKLEQMLEFRRAQFKKALPQLEAMFNLKGGESFVKYYEGLAGVKNAYESVLEDVGATDFYYAMADEEAWRNLDEQYFLDYRARRGKRIQHPIKILLQHSEAAKDVVKFQANYNLEAKLLPEHSKLTTGLIVTPQKVLIQQLTSPVLAIVIENQSVIGMHKEMFEIMWQAL